MTTAPCIPFIEPKIIDWSNVEKLLAASARQNQWTNFGPAGEAFAARVADILRLGPGRTVVPASSATTALHAVMGLHAVLAGRPLVWAVSAFGFFSTVIGPMAGQVRIVDCDQSGMLDFDALAALAPEDWDGLLLTDIFGFNSGMWRYRDLCRTQGKPFVIDSAASFPAFRDMGSETAEIISFHHTKPWGLGEGGCAVVDRHHAPIVRAFLNYGRDIDSKFRSFATNGKLSDPAAAMIIDRLSQRPNWLGAYQTQRRRILGLAAQAGMGCLGQPAAEVASPHLPLMAPQPVALQDLPRARFVVQKYYRPLSRECLCAASIFARIVNVPCHPMMAQASDAEIAGFFHDVRRAAVS